MAVLEIKHRNDLRGRTILNAPEQTIVIPINTVGAMGAGIAKEVRDKYPSIYKKYRLACKRDICTPRSLLTAKIGDGQQLLLFPTKIDWLHPAIPEMIIDGIDRLGRFHKELNIESIAFPQLGTGCGQIKYKVREEMENTIREKLFAMDLDCTWYLDN